MKKYFGSLFRGAFFLVASTGVVSAQNLAPEAIQAHIEYLASDQLEGRGTASLGEIRAANYIAGWFDKAGLKPKGDIGTYFQAFPVVMSYEGIPHQVTARNVVGYLDNQAERTIVIGAHFDHLGKGFQAGSLTPESKDMIHNGADDNASGTAGVIELARYFAGNGTKEKFNFLFIAFSGEELGLFGSKYFAGHATVPMESVAFMINMDMVGRLEDDKGVTIGGWGTSPSWGKLMPGIARKNQVRYAVDSSGIGPSDHTSFYLKEKPVLFFFTGIHTDYHKPSDDAEKINAAGEQKILKMIVDLVEELDKTGEVPAFREAGNPHAQATQQTFKVTLGIIPDYSFSGKGLRIDGVSKDRPAEVAGMEAGDVIVRMGEYPVNDIQDYMKNLGRFEKGQKTEVEVRRKDKMKVLNVTF
jgi:hypothetical protein